MGDTGDSVHGTFVPQTLPSLRFLHHVALVVDHVLLAPLRRGSRSWQLA